MKPLRPEKTVPPVVERIAPSPKMRIRWKTMGQVRLLKRRLRETLRALRTYRRRYRAQLAVSVTLAVIAATAILWRNAAILFAAPTLDTKTITTQAQFDQGTYSNTVSQNASGGEVRLAGSGGPDGTQYKRTVTIDNTGNASTLTNYQVSLTLDTASLITAGKMQVDCDDIRFRDTDDATSLNFWFEGPCNNASSKIWVKVPSIAASSTKATYLYYGSASATIQSSVANTFIREITGVTGAWRLDEASGNVSDYSGNGYTGTPTGTTVVTGKFGNARSFSGNTNYITTSTAVGTTVAMSMWVVDSIPPNPYGMLWRTGPNGVGPDAFFYNNKISLNTWNGDANPFCTIPADAANGNFHHYVFNIASGTGNTNLYYDNALCGAATYANPAANNFTLSSGVTYDWYGKIDEVRVYNHVLSTNEISDLYNNYGYVTTNYPGKELVRKYSSPEPSTALGGETPTLQPSGTWTSAGDANALDVIWNGGWANNANGNAFEATVTLPANTDIDFELRISTDRATWTGWYNMTDADANAGRYGVAAATLEAQFPQATYVNHRYLQIRATLTQTDGSNPTLSDVSISYLKDVDPPSSNPTETHCYNDAGLGTEYTTNTWYNDASIYCTWSGAADAHSGVTGYYVYFGTNASADPATDGASQSAATYTLSGMTSGQTYYLRIKTYDRVGNTTTTTYQGFIYRFDTTPPQQPGVVAANPAGYTNVNLFTFLWAAGTDGDSGVAGYLYKTGAAGASDTYTTQTSVSGITAYQDNINLFYVRTRDVAGNASSAYAQVNYYYNGTAPSEPQNLQVSPATNSVNSFTFTWNPPAIFTGSIASYHYSVNALPTAQNTSTTTGTTLGPGPYATQQGVNTFYVVAKDAAGNVNYNAYASVEFTATTTAPGIPTSVTATDSSIRAQQKYSITITWNAPSNVGSGIDRYSVERSTSTGCAAGSGTFTAIATTATTGYLDANLSNATTYCYRVKASDNAGASSAASSVVSLRPEGRYTAPPVLIGSPGVKVQIQSATVEWLTDREGSSFVEFGLTAGQLDRVLGQDDFVAAHTVTLLDLKPATTYYYRAKWTDQDNNTGTSTVASFATSDAPGPPQSLTVTPTSSTRNSFTFSWGAPADVGVTLRGYFYSINDVPTATNTSFTSQTTLGPGPYATRQGTNVFSIVAVDDANNVNYNNYASVGFSAATPAPVIPTGLIITDASNRETKDYSIALKWKKSGTAASSIQGATNESDVSYDISRSTDGTTFTTIASTISTGYLDVDLDNTKTYSYYVKAKDSAGSASAASTIVSEIPEGRYTTPPTITVVPTVSPKSFSATVAWETERPTTSFVQFGTTAASLTDEQGTSTLVADHDIRVEGLTPETAYFYRVKSVDVDGNVNHSTVGTFTTNAAPRVSDAIVSNIRLYDALVRWETNTETTTAVEYGPTVQYGTTVTEPSGSRTKTHLLQLERLSDDTTYHLRFRGADDEGTPVSSDDYTFTTLTTPKVSDSTTQNKSEGQTEIVWKTNVPTTSVVEYYGETIPPKTQGNTSLVTDHSVLLFDLEDATLYKFKVHGADQFGYEAVSEEREFTTLEDTTPPEVFGVATESNTIGSGEVSKIQIVVSWKTNEPTTSQVEFGVGLAGSEFTDQTEESAELVLDHLVVIAELAPAKTYHVRVVSRDKAGNQTTSGSYSILTSRRRQSFLQLIISNFEETFSWLGDIDRVFSGGAP